MKNNDIQLSIKNNFIKLYQQKNIEEIKVNDICKLASISRTTFYHYYKNTSCILKEIEDTIISDMLSIYNEYNYLEISSLPKSSPAPNFYEMYKYILTHQNTFKCVFGNNGNPSFKTKTYKTIFKNLETTLKKHFKNEENLKCVCSICTEHIIASCKILLEYNKTITPKSLSINTQKYINDIILNKQQYLKNEPQITNNQLQKAQ